MLKHQTAIEVLEIYQLVIVIHLISTWAMVKVLEDHQLLEKDKKKIKKSIKEIEIKSHQLPVQELKM